jgi:hypothetical protein
MPDRQELKKRICVSWYCSGPKYVDGHVIDAPNVMGVYKTVTWFSTVEHNASGLRPRASERVYSVRSMKSEKWLSKKAGTVGLPEVARRGNSP